MDRNETPLPAKWQAEISRGVTIWPMDALRWLAQREGVPENCFQLTQDVVRTLDRRPVRQLVYRLRRRGISMILDAFRDENPDLSAQEVLGLRAQLVRVDDQTESAWQCLTWEESIRERLFRWWTTEIQQFRHRTAMSQQSLEPIVVPLAPAVHLDDVANSKVAYAGWFVTSHAQTLHAGDVLAVIPPTYLLSENSDYERILQRVYKWKLWYGSHFTYLRRIRRRLTLECIDELNQRFLPWLHPPWS